MVWVFHDSTGVCLGCHDRCRGIVWVSLLENICISQYRVTVPKNGSIVDLKEAMQRLTGVDPTKVRLLCYIFYSCTSHHLSTSACCY